MKTKLVGQVKIGREKIRDFIYPRVRLPTEFEEWIDQKVLVYKGELGGEEVIILSRDQLTDLANNLAKVSQLANNSETISQLAKQEERISRLEKAIEKLTELIDGNKPQTNFYSEKEWARGDLNSRPLPRQGNVITS